MRPVPIPDAALPSDARRLTVGAPRGMEDLVRPLEVAVAGDREYGIRSYVLIALEPGDLDQLADTGHFWLSWLGPTIVPFTLDQPPWESAR